MVSLAAGWHRPSGALWAGGQRAEAIQSVIAEINRRRDKADPRLFSQLGYYLFLTGDYGAASMAMRQHVARAPDDVEAHANLAACLSRMDRDRDAIAVARRTLALDADNLLALDVLAKCHARLGEHDAASGFGSRALDTKDRLSTAGTTATVLPDGSPRAFATRPGKRHVVAFSMWGNGPRYLRGALRNALLMPDIYPGWQMRLHADQSVPSECLELLADLGVEIVMVDAAEPLLHRLARRFRVASDPGVGYFLVRDVDSVIGVRERVAVDAWLAADRWFHVMRDWWTHTDLMLAGMWGGVAGALPDIATLLATYRPGMLETPNIDQWFLRDRVWPHVRGSCTVHDRCFRPAGAEPFPGVVPEGNRHVGQDEYAARRKEQERVLRGWVQRYGWLGTA